MFSQKIEKMQQLTSRIQNLKEDFRNDPIPFNIRSEQVNVEDLIEYAQENYHLLEEVVSIAKELTELGL